MHMLIPLSGLCWPQYAAKAGAHAPAVLFQESGYITWEKYEIANNALLFEELEIRL